MAKQPPKPAIDRASYRAGYQAGIAAKRRHPDPGVGVADLYFAACMAGLLSSGRATTEQTAHEASYAARLMLNQREN